MRGIKKVEKYPVRKCKYKRCGREIVIKRGNKGQEYCNIRCWTLAHGITPKEYEEAMDNISVQRREV